MLARNVERVVRAARAVYEDIGQTHWKKLRAVPKWASGPSTVSLLNPQVAVADG